MTSEDLALMGITPATVLYVMSWGFGAVLLGWKIGYGVAIALTLIKKI